MKIYIRNMVSLCCKEVVKDIFLQNEAQIKAIHLGLIELENYLGVNVIEKAKIELEKYGLEIMHNKRDIQIERIKNLLIECVYLSDEPLEIKYSQYLSDQLGYNYTYLSNLFSEETGATIQQHIIFLKIKRAKELILNSDLNVKEIAYRLHYSSIAHFCNQFKKVVGHTPVQYKLFKLKAVKTAKKSSAQFLRCEAQEFCGIQARIN